MRFKAKKLKEISDLQSVADGELAAEEKLDELIALFNAYKLDSTTVKKIQHKFNDAVDDNTLSRRNIEVFKVIDEKENSSREELLDEFSNLLLTNKFDSNVAGNYLKSKRLNKITLIALGIVMITLGFAMIIMPAPPYFEMFTIFYFSNDDGVTLMDLISLAIIFAGIYILIRSLYKK